MASTSQTALEYLSNARVHLVGKLRNHSVILENLYQQGILHDEEVSKIKTEKDDYDKNRALLDSVIKKGEASCYQLLRIIDQTRRRTLERPNSDETTAKEFNLHQWICCFSFKEEAETDTNYLQGSRPCHRYQSKLKSKGNKLSKDFWKASNKLFQNKNPDLSYTPLVLDTNDRCSPSKIKKCKNKKSKLSRPKKLRTYIPEDIPEISPTRLLEMDKDILLVGKPGTGKTALSHEMLRLWSERDDKELDYMFYFDMREITNIPLDMSLEDLLFNCYSEPDEGRDEILEDIERNSENVTIILDGVTDLSSSVMKKLVEKDLLSDAKIIITCRPDDEEDLCLEDWFRVEVKGFSEGTIKTYLSKALGEDHQEVLSNVELLTLSHVPMYALMVAASFSSGVSLQPKTVTEIYINIVRFSLQMNSNRTRMKNLNQFIRTKRDEIMSLAEAAFYATQRKTVNLEGLSFEDSCILSFLKSLDVNITCTKKAVKYAFLHYTMQEFFAALWLLTNPEKIREVFQQSFTEEMKHMKHVIPFMCQLLNEENPSLMSCLVPDEKLVETQEWFFKQMIDTFFQKAHDSELYVDTLFLCQCLYESQSSEDCIAFLDKLNFHLNLSGENLDPHSCQAVAFIVTQSKERKISLNLKDVTLSEQGMRQLLRCLQHVKWCDPLPQQLWRVVLLSNGQTGYKTLLDLCENQLHLSVVDKKMLFENAVKVMQREDAKVTVCLHWVRGVTVCQSLSECLLQALPKISNLSKWPLSAYPLTNSQYRVVDQLGPGRSAAVFSFPSCLLAAGTFRFLLLQTAEEASGRSALSVRVESAGRRRGQARAERQPMVQTDSTDC
ncbi:PREDICTED: NACHT, LRR and PYD domains-containing protein 12-like [Cyprinodon variegatus]|uniref:NACHT, LRR and PYD domains-containing protein 12-like n=1 Tax=Cyprinodon variegatus TaxID=28743 RepID=UPI000742C11E|nr:PREDICTED: NACHT, LRR and PYD domains-containing protein 12-like [Cyprinodon variegatus]